MIRGRPPLTEVRVHLDNDRVKKLVAVYQNLRIQKDI